MQPAAIALTAVFLRSPDGYVGFVEELPGVNAFDAERRGAKSSSPARTTCASRS